MKKILSFLFGILLVLSCSTNPDDNDNSTPVVVPIAPSDLIGAVVSSTQNTLSWTDNSTTETAFKIQRRSGSGSYIVVGTINKDVLTFSDAGLTPSTTYTYRVYSFNAAGFSPTYSNEVTVTTTATTSLNIAGPNVTDIDGNTYQSVTNCGLTVTKRNLNVSRYSDGTTIPQVNDPTQWANLTTGAWCYYNNDPASAAVYGKLYNWYATAGIYNAASLSNPALRKKLAPIGWHVPSYSEATQLIDCLGGTSIAGGKMKSTGTSLWQSPNTAATNESGFSGFPGGYRGYNGPFSNIGTNGAWWSSSETTSTNAWILDLNSNDGSTYSYNVDKNYGFSVRCKRD